MKATQPADDEVIARALAILESRLRKHAHTFLAANDVKSYLRLHYRDHGHEEFNVLFLNSDGKLIANECLARGTINRADVYPREVARSALKHNAASVILAHNHPEGSSKPSEPDKQMTKVMRAALGMVGVEVIDHMVVGTQDVHSFVQNGTSPFSHWERTCAPF